MKYLIFLGMAFFGLISGCQRIYISATESKITNVEYKDLLSSGSDSSWLGVKNADFSIMDTYYEESFGGSIKKLYIPLQPLTENAKIKYILVTKDSNLLNKFTAVKNKKDEIEVMLGVVKLTSDVEKYKNFNAMIGGWGDVTSKVEDEIKKDETVEKDPVFLIHNQKPEFGDAILRLGFGFAGVFLFVYCLKTAGSKENEAEQDNKTVETAQVSKDIWPTPVGEDGTSPTLITLLADSSPIITNQAQYLTRVLERIKDEFKTEAVQLPLVSGDSRITIPALLKDRNGESVYLYTESEDWHEHNFQLLIYWTKALQAINPNTKILVCSEYESPHVINLEGVHEHKIISLRE